MNEIITVLSAELTRRLRSRAFILGLVLGTVLVALMIKAPQFVDKALSSSVNSVVLAGSPQLTGWAALLLAKDYTIVAKTPLERTSPQRLLRLYPKAQAVVTLATGHKRLRVEIFAKVPGSISASDFRRDLLPLNLAVATGRPRASAATLMNFPIRIVAIDSKFADAASARTAHEIASTLIFFLYVSILLNSQLLMGAVAEEKTSRIAELLIASVNPSALLAGKIVAAGVLAFIQMGSWLGVALLLGAQGSPAGTSDANAAITAASALPVDIFVAFGAFFLLGFLQYATLFAAAASLINRTEDLGSVSMPIIVPVLIALFLAIAALSAPNNVVCVLTSMVPFLSPFVMFARIAVSEVPPVQLIVCVALNILTIAGVAVLGGKLYRVGMLLYGRPPRLSQILKILTSPS